MKKFSKQMRRKWLRVVGDVFSWVAFLSIGRFEIRVTVKGSMTDEVIQIVIVIEFQLSNLLQVDIDVE
jgi:hypothetical protein